jgi:hypothetical protein
MRNAVVLLLCFVLSACAMQGGVQVEGRASQVTPPPSTPPPPSNVTPSYDAVALLRSDPKVSENIKSQLTPCLQDRYPVDTRFVDLTNDGYLDLIATIVPCDPKVQSQTASMRGGAVATYVYNLKPVPPVEIFGTEEPGVQLNDIQIGKFENDEKPAAEGMGLLLMRSMYRAGDKPCCPSDAVYEYYKWNGTAFEPILRK